MLTYIQVFLSNFFQYVSHPRIKYSSFCSQVLRLHLSEVLICQQYRNFILYNLFFFMDKIWNPQAWPKPLFHKFPLLSYLKSTSFKLTIYTFPSKFIDYLATLCSQKQAPVELLQLTLSIASRYLCKNYAYNQPIQLVLLASLYLAGKVIGNVDGTEGGLAINQLHKYSNHCFTNKDFYRMEKKILQQINFDIFAQGLCDRLVKGILLLVKQIINEGQYRVLCKVTDDLQVILWQHLYTKSEKERFFKKMQKGDLNETKMETLLTASIIQASFIMCTQCVGRFPSSVWIINVLELKEDEVNLMVEEILKIALGKQKLEELKI